MTGSAFTTFLSALCTLVILAPGADAQTPGVAYGFKVEAASAVGVSLYPVQPDGARRGTLMIIAKDVNDCMKGLPDAGSWRDLCATAFGSTGNRMRLEIISRPAKGDLVQEAIMPADRAGFPFTLTLELSSDDRILSLSAHPQGGLPAVTSLPDTRAAFEAMRVGNVTGDAVTAQFRGANGGFAQKLELGAPLADGSRSALLSFYYRQDAGRDCLADMRQSGNQGGWSHLCEKADKDGLQELTGRLEPLNGGAAHAGQVTTADGMGYWLVTSQARMGWALVGLRTLDEPAFVSANVTENVTFDGVVADTPTSPPTDPISVGPGNALSSHLAYRLGAFTEAKLELTPGADGVSYDMHFRLDRKPDNYSFEQTVSDCSRTLNNQDVTWARQCEKATKDRAAFEMSGSLKPVSWRRDAFSGLISTADGGWSAQALVVSPGARMIDAALSHQTDPGFQRSYTLLPFDTMARPLTPPPAPVPPSVPVAPPGSPSGSNSGSGSSSSSGTSTSSLSEPAACARVLAFMAGLASDARRRDAGQLLSQVGFWGGILPTDAKGCARALDELIAAGFAQPGSASLSPSATPTQPPSEPAVSGQLWQTGQTLSAQIRGTSSGPITLADGRDSILTLTIPPISGCYQADSACSLFQQFPGQYTLRNIANGRDHLYGQFLVQGDLHLLRIDRQSDGALAAYVLPVAGSGTLLLGYFGAP